MFSSLAVKLYLCFIQPSPEGKVDCAARRMRATSYEVPRLRSENNAPHRLDAPQKKK